MVDDKKKPLLFLSNQLLRNLLTFYPPSEVFQDYWEAIPQIIGEKNFILSHKDYEWFRERSTKTLNEGRVSQGVREKILKAIGSTMGSKVENTLKEEYVEKWTKILREKYKEDLYFTGGEITKEEADVRGNFLVTIAHILAWRNEEEGDLVLMVDNQFSGMLGNVFFRGVMDNEKIHTESFTAIAVRLRRNENGKWELFR